MRSAWRGLAFVGLACMAIFVVAACGGKSKSSESSSTTTSSGSPTVGVDDLTADFAAMKTLKPLASRARE